MNTTNRESPNELHGASSSLSSSLEHEVDFYQNPSVLGRLILTQQFHSAAKRLQNAPNEASIWLVSSPDNIINPSSSRKRPATRMGLLQRSDSWPSPNNRYKGESNHRNIDATVPIRQLPLHMACTCFLKTKNASAGEKLDMLIKRLVETYPQACSERDHRGRLPLHEAISWGASAESISIILMAYPEALQEKDYRGLFPQEVLLFRQRSGANSKDLKEIDKLLRRVYQIWHQSRTEAILRLKLGIRTDIHHYDDTERTMSETKEVGGSHRRKSSQLAELGDRNTQLEQLLADVYRRNDELSEVVNRLIAEREQLWDRLEHLDTASLRIYEMEDINSDLRKVISRQELLLRDLGLDWSGDDYHPTAEMTEDEGVSMMSMDPEPPTVLTKYLENKVTNLEEENELLDCENKTFREQIRELRQFVFTLQENETSEKKINKGNNETPFSPPMDSPETDKASSSPTDGNKSSKQNNYVKGSEGILSVSLDEAISVPASVENNHIHESNESASISEGYLSIEGTFASSMDETDAILQRDESSKAEEHTILIATSADPTIETAEPADGTLPMLQRKIEKLQSQLMEALEENDKLRNSDHRNLGDAMSPEESRMNSLADRLQEVNRRSPTQSSRPDPSSVYSSTKHRVASISSGGARSMTSWGVLSLTQKAQKTPKIKKRSNSLEAPPRGSNSIASIDIGTFHDSMDSLVDKHKSDDLSVLFNSAASFYESQKEKNSQSMSQLEGHKSTTDFGSFMPQPGRFRSKQCRRFSDGGVSPAVQARQQLRHQPENNPDPLADAARLLAAEEELIMIIKEAEEKLEMELPHELVAALRDASLHTASVSRNSFAGEEIDALHTFHSVAESLVDYKLIDVTEHLYGESILLEVVSSLQAASVSRIETSRKEYEEIQAMVTMKRRLEQELLDALIETAERQLQRPLPPDVSTVLREAASSFDSLLHEESDEADVLQAITLDFKEFQRMLQKAQELYGVPFTKEILIALRRASFVLQSRLEGTDLIGDQEIEVLNYTDTTQAIRVIGAQRDDQTEANSIAGSSVDPSLHFTSLFPESEATKRDKAHRAMHPDRGRSQSPPRDPMSGRSHSLFTKMEESNDMDSSSDEDEEDEIRSTDFSKTSEISLDFLCVTQKYQPSELGTNRITIGGAPKALFGNENRSAPSTPRGSREHFKQKPHRHASTNTPTVLDMEKTLQRGRRKSKSFDLEIFSTIQTRESRRTNSVEIEKASSLSPKSSLGITKRGESLNSLAQTLGSDNLDVLYKHAANQTEGNNMSLKSIFPESSGDAAFETIISDTEETYGIEIPSGVVDGLKKAAFDFSPDVSFLSIVRSLHDDDVIRQAERYHGIPIPDDLIAAIRSTSLPPGMSVETLTSHESLPRYGDAWEKGNDGDNLASKQNESRFAKLNEKTLGPSQRAENKHSKMADEKAAVLESAELFGPAKAQRSKPGSDGTKALTLEGNKPFGTAVLLDPMVESRSSDLVSPSAREDEQIMIGMLRPNPIDSCLRVSPQDMELDMLLEEFECDTGTALAFDVDVALRKASRSIDESLDFIAPVKAQSNRAFFGSHFPPERLEILYEETEIYLGGKIPPNVFAAVTRASNQLQNSGRRPQSRRETRQTGGLRVEQKSVESPVKTKPVIEGVFTPSHFRKNFSVPGQPKRASIDTLSSVAFGQEDDLGELYKAAYAESPRPGNTNLSQPKQTSPKAPPDFTSTKLVGGISTLSLFISPAGTEEAQSKPTAKSPPRDLSPPAPSFLNKRVPLSEVVRSESSGQPEELSPITACSMGTDGNSSRGDRVNVMTASKARLAALCQIPGLDPEEEKEKTKEKDDWDELKFEDLAMELEKEKSERSQRTGYTMDELAAIISEVQQEYGMELPSELVEALQTASIASLSTDFFGSSLGTSGTSLGFSLGGSSDVSSSLMSSLVMRNIDLGEDDNEDPTIQHLVAGVRERLLMSSNSVSRSIGTRWAIEEYLTSLIHKAEHEFREPISTALLLTVRSSIFSTCVEKSVSTLSWEEVDGIVQTSCNQVGEPVSFDLLHAFKLASEELLKGRNKKSEQKQTDSFAGSRSDASGHFSAVSENEEVSVLFDGIDDQENNVDDILHEVKDLTGFVPSELVEKLQHVAKGDELEYSAATSMDLEYSASTAMDLEYSASTLGATSSHSNRLPSPLYKRLSQVSGNEESLSKIQEDDEVNDFNMFIAQATKEYGQPLPPEILVALKSMSISGLTYDGEIDVGASIKQPLSAEIATALKRAARKASMSRPLSRQTSLTSRASAVFKASGVLSRSRQASLVSSTSAVSKASAVSKMTGVSSLTPAASLDDSGSSASDWTVDDEAELLNILDQDSDIVQPPPPPPPSTGTPTSTISTPSVPVNPNPGRNLMREVKKLYKQKIPHELTYVLSKSTALPSAMNTDEEMRIIRKECDAMSGRRLPADLLLSLREASVTLRTPANSKRSRRSNLIRQGSGSFRSTSRSSSMPSIRERSGDAGEDQNDEEILAVDRIPGSFRKQQVPTEIKASSPSTKSGSQVASNGSEGFSISTKSLLSYATVSSARDECSIGVDELRGSRSSPPGSSHASSPHLSGSNPRMTPTSPGFNNSTATQLMSNQTGKKKWIPSLIAPAFSTDSSLNTSDHTEKSSNISVRQSRSNTSESGTEFTISTADNMSYVSNTSTLPSRKLPIGVNPTHPLDGTESDDLSAIFKEAAKRMG